MVPVQGEGNFDSFPFYFRARGDHWFLYLNPFQEDEIVVASAKYENAGFIPKELAQIIIENCYDMWKGLHEAGLSNLLPQTIKRPSLL